MSIRFKGWYIFALVFAVIAFAVLSTLTLSKPVETIQIGIMSTGTRHVPGDQFQGEYAKAEINTYCEENDIPYRFEFNYTDANNQAGQAVELTKWYDENGIDIIIGYNWGSFLDASDGETKHSGITVISPSSTSSQHRTIYPHIIKLTPLETHQVEAIALAIIDGGFDKVVTLYEPNAGWGYDFVPRFNESYTGLGGEVIANLKTPSMSNAGAFNYSLGRVEETVVNASRTYGNDSLTVLATWNYIYPDALNFLSKRPGLMNVTWYGTDQLLLLPTEIYNSLDVLSQLSVIQPVIDRSPYTENPVYIALNDAYVAEFDKNLTRYGGALYDACWIAALSVIEAGSTLNTTLIEAIPRVASGYTGATGECSLDEYGDRATADFILYEYMDVEGVVTPVETGYYYWSTGKIEWTD